MAQRIAVQPGEKIGRLTFIARTTGVPRGQALFQCDCGNIHRARVSFWKRGDTSSCGCLSKEVRASIRTTHGQTSTPLYRVYYGMRQRTRGDYHLKPYGRSGYEGVKCDPRWATFEGFLAHPPAGQYEPGKVLARYGDTGDYTPENCRWATKAENSREANEPKMHRMPDGRFALDVARENGITTSAFWDRMQSGWTTTEAATLPKGTRR